MSYQDTLISPEDQLLKQNQMVQFLHNITMETKFGIDDRNRVFVAKSLPTYPRRSEFSKTHNRYVELDTKNDEWFILFSIDSTNKQPKLFKGRIDNASKDYDVVQSITPDPTVTIIENFSD